MFQTAIHPPVLDLRRPEGAAALARGWQHLADRASLPTQDAAFVAALHFGYELAEQDEEILSTNDSGHDEIIPRRSMTLTFPDSDRSRKSISARCS